MNLICFVCLLRFNLYKFNGKLFCSDSFQPGGDAATQYNTEPYFNEKKPRLEPNFSFDLCRLACSIFDYVVDDFESINNEFNGLKYKDNIDSLNLEQALEVIEKDKKNNSAFT